MRSLVPSSLDYEAEKVKREERRWPTWLYLLLFLAPATIVGYVMAVVLGQELLFSGIVALAVMNGSINSVIAYMTIQLDTKSSESLQHLENINNEMDRLEEVLEEANQKVSSFTNDLDDAKGLFQKVGVDLRDLDLEPIAEVVEKLKENKSGLNSVLDNMRSIDVDDYIQQAKRIDWKQLMDAAEEIMGFIQKRPAETKPVVSTSDIMSNITITQVPEEIDEPEEDIWDREDFNLGFEDEEIEDEEEDDNYEYYTEDDDDEIEESWVEEPKVPEQPKISLKRDKPTLKRRR